MALADFLQFVVTTHFFRIRLPHASTRPPRVLTRSFPLCLPHLPQTIPCSYWAPTCLGALPSLGALYAISLRQARGLPTASFRFCLTADTFALGYILPAAGRIRVFHPLERALAGRTNGSGCKPVACIRCRMFKTLLFSFESPPGSTPGPGGPQFDKPGYKCPEHWAGGL